MALFTSAMIAGWLGITAGFWTAAAAIVLNMAVGFGVSLLTRALMGEQTPGYSVQGKLQVGADIPRSILIGLCCTAGSLVYANTWGHAGRTPNAYITQVIALSDMPIQYVNKVFVSGEDCTMDLDSPHASYGYPVEEYRKGGKDHLWIKVYDGNQTTADSFLVNTVSSTERPYTSDRVGYGVAYAIVTGLLNDELFTGFPQVRFECLGMKLYNPSLDSTAEGGTGTHRWGNKATWGGAGDYNTAVQIYNILRGIYYNDIWVYGLQGMSAPRIPTLPYIAQIAKCDIEMPIWPTGSEAQYRTGGEIPLNSSIADTIEGLLSGCSGKLSEIGGFYKLHVGEPDSAVASIMDDDIVSTQEKSFVPFFGLNETITGITARYPNPAESWNPKIAPGSYLTDVETRLGGRRMTAQVNLDFVPYGIQVQRLIQSALLEAQRARRHTFVLSSKFWYLEPGDYIQWTSEQNGYIDKLFRIDGILDRDDLDIMVDITEVDPSDYDFDIETDYRVIRNSPIGPIRPGPQPVIDFDANGVIIIGDNGLQTVAAELIWDGAVEGIAAVEWQIRRAIDDVIVTTGRTERVDAGLAYVTNAIFSTTNYEAQIKYIPTSPREMEWSNWLAFTTPNAPNNDIDYNEIIRRYRELEDWARRDTRETIEEMRNNIVYDWESIAQEYTHRQTLRRELAIADANAEARFREQIDIAIGPNSAIAQQLTELTARLDNSNIEGIADAINAITVRVDYIDGQLVAVSQRFDQYEAAIGGSISDVILAMQATVTQQGNDIDANSNFIASLNSLVGNVAAGGLLRIFTQATPTGATARIALSVATSTPSSAESAAIFLDAMTGGGSQISMIATRTVIVPTSATNAARRNPFVFSGTTLYLDSIVAQWANISAAVIGNFIAGEANIGVAAINSAHIQTLTVNDFHIVPGAVSRNVNAIKAWNASPITTTGNVWQATISNPQGYPVIIKAVCPVQYGHPSVSSKLRLRVMKSGSPNVQLTSDHFFEIGATVNTQQSLYAETTVDNVPNVGNNTYFIEVTVISGSGTRGGLEDTQLYLSLNKV